MYQGMMVIENGIRNHCRNDAFVGDARQLPPRSFARQSYTSQPTEEPSRLSSSSWVYLAVIAPACGFNNCAIRGTQDDPWGVSQGLAGREAISCRRGLANRPSSNEELPVTVVVMPKV